MGEYKKPWLTFEEQADLLIVERGLVQFGAGLGGSLIG